MENSKNKYELWYIITSKCCDSNYAVIRRKAGGYANLVCAECGKLAYGEIKDPEDKHVSIPSPCCDAHYALHCCEDGHSFIACEKCGQPIASININNFAKLPHAPPKQPLDPDLSNN